MSAGAMTLTAFLTLAETCGNGVAPATLAKITSAESRFDAYAINVNGADGGTVRGITSKSQAIAKAKALIRQGRDFDAGVAQINFRNWGWLGLTPETAFDPCESIRAQAMLLQSYSRYNTGSPVRGFTNGYVARVVSQSASVRAAVQARSAEPNASPCVSYAPPWAVGLSPRRLNCAEGKSE